MFIDRIVNNNVVFSKDDEGQEIVVTGRGIAFGQKVGMEINADNVEKIFVVKNFDNTARMEDMLNEIPIEYFEVSNKIINFGKTHLGKRLNERIYLSLSDHIYTAVGRFKGGITLKNPMLWDIKRFYKEEFIVGKKALDIIEEHLGVQMPEEEAGFITLHFVNSSMDEDIETIYELTNIMQEITNIVKYHFHIDFDTDSIYYYRFITHLKFFAQRLASKKTYDSEEESDLLEIIKVKYVNAYECVKKISEFLYGKYEYQVSSEEMLYLTIHIERLVYKSEK